MICRSNLYTMRTAVMLALLALVVVADVEHVPHAAVHEDEAQDHHYRDGKHNVEFDHEAILGLISYINLFVNQFNIHPLKVLLISYNALYSQ